MTKKKNHKHRKKRNRRKSSAKSVVFAAFLLFISLFFIFGIYKYYENLSSSSSQQHISIENQKSTKELMTKMKKMLEEEKIRVSKNLIVQKKEQNISKVLTKKTVEKIENAIEKKEVKENYLSEIHDFQKSLQYTKKSIKKSKKAIKYKGLPRLAIIIDDVSFLNQVKLIKKIPYKINPSFFPPSKRHPDTIGFSKQFKFAMIHIPLEALSYAHSESKTLLVSDSFRTIKNRVLQIKKDFPWIKYYNNHTGSKFTSNLSAMRKLLKIMKNQKLHFVDSRTTADTKAGIVSKELGVKLLSRDIFLDNSVKKADIILQLKKAVKIAKKTGYAIAIGHPHSNTLNVLIKAKPFLKGVKLVYVDEL